MSGKKYRIETSIIVEDYSLYYYEVCTLYKYIFESAPTVLAVHGEFDGTNTTFLGENVKLLDADTVDELLCKIENGIGDRLWETFSIGEHLYILSMNYHKKNNIATFNIARFDFSIHKNIYADNIFVDSILDFFRHDFQNHSKYSVSGYDTLRFIIGSVLLNIGYVRLNMLNELSSLNYESQSLNCRIAIVNQSELGKLDLRFDDSIGSWREIRFVRKILEMGTDIYVVVVCDGECVGIAKQANLKDIHIIIEFNGYLKWNIYHNGKIVLRFYDGRYHIPKVIDETDYQTTSSIFDIDESKLKNLIVNLKKQKHGTVLIIAEDAEKEANRLCHAGKGILIQPYNLYEKVDTLMSITSMDGAVIIDKDFECYGIALIVDGISVVEGKPSRGARYNSLNNYIAWKKINGLNYSAVIVSEDGMVDIKTTRDSFDYLDEYRMDGR